MKMKNKVAIVTGASKGIGKGIAIRFAKEGAAVVLASRTMNLLQKAASEINEAGGRALALEVNVMDAFSVENMVRQTVEEFGQIDILVNNAGIAMAFPSEKLDPAEWDKALKTDLYGVFYGCQSAARRMVDRGGCIINISSIYGIVAAPMRASYCASKAACNMLTKVLAVEWAKWKIRVNAIAPGYIRTELTQELIQKGILELSAIEKRTPQGRIGEVSDVISAAVYLASDEASYVTGTILTIDGGWTAYGYL
jgi:NAD(P)-dependent dehydrogenase (short-subunit alcohol dehydrogenase family)